MRKTSSLAALVAATAGLLLPAAPASASITCDVIFQVATTYDYLDTKLGDRLPNVVWYCPA